MNTKKIAYLMMGIMLITSCESFSYKKTPSGIHYKVNKKGDGTVPNKGDILTLAIRYETKDSVVLFDSNSLDMPFTMPYPGELTKEQEGGIEECIRLLKKGDEITCKLLAKKLLGPSYDAIAKEYKLEENTVLFLHLHLKDFTTEEAYRKAQQDKWLDMLDKKKKQDEEQLPKDLETIKKYIDVKKIKALSTPSGLHYTINKLGHGDFPQEGDTVAVDYVGKTLEGKVFDTSRRDVATAHNIYHEKRVYEPLRFTVGVGQMIPGFEEGVRLLKKGGKSLLIVPSVLAYRDMELGEDIKPHTNLLFEVELVEIHKADKHDNHEHKHD